MNMAAIDPVELIEEHHFSTPFVDDLEAVLKRLANLSASMSAPYLTMTLDWQPDGSNPKQRASQVFFNQQRGDFFSDRNIKPHTPEHDSLSADFERIATFLDDQIDPAVQGIAIIACSARRVFETILLGMPLPNRIVTGPTPALRVLAKLAEDEAPYAVLLVDQQQATLSIIDQAARNQSLELRSTGYPRKQMQGGWSQRRYQMRADERVEAFVRTVAEETGRALQEANISSLVLAGNEQITTTLRDALHPTMQDRIVGMTRMDLNANEREIIAATLPIVEQAERERETVVVGRIQNGAGPGGGAVIGPVETLTALQAGQVITLVMNDDFSMPGWADYSFPVYGVGDLPADHPTGGDPGSIVPIDLEEEMVRLAFQFDADIEIVRTAEPITAGTMPNDATGGSLYPRVHAATALDELGGIGALLRFVLADDHSTADL